MKEKKAISRDELATKTNPAVNLTEFSSDAWMGRYRVITL